jgi:uncharacterized MnhB-related membrane protein
MTWIVLIVVIVMLFAALATMFLPNMLAAVAASSVVSLSVAVVFVFLKAPDVAMTEAAIGAGLSSLLLALGLARLGLWQLDPDDLKEKKPLAGDNKPLAWDKKPLAGDTKPLAGDNNPLAGSQKPLTEDNNA